MKITNKDIIQSYVLTTAKYEFNAYEKRILYRLVEMMQAQTKGERLNSGFTMIKTERDDRIITMPIASFLRNDDDENYTRVKKALRSLRNKTIEYDDGKHWKIIGIIEKPNLEYSGFVTFELQPEIYQAILDFSKGFRKYELKTAMEFESVYSMRFYELFSGQKSPLTYSIDNLKIMFQIEGKYKLVADFLRRVVIPAQKELNKKSPYSFEYKSLKTGRKITSIKFYPVYIAENRDENLEKKNLQKQISPRWELDKIVIDYLKQSFCFTTKEIQSNIDLLKFANQHLDLMLELSQLKVKAMNSKKSPQAYVIGTIKRILKSNNIEMKAVQTKMF